MRSTRQRSDRFPLVLAALVLVGSCLTACTDEKAPLPAAPDTTAASSSLDGGIEEGHAEDADGFWGKSGQQAPDLPPPDASDEQVDSAGEGEGEGELPADPEEPSPPPECGIRYEVVLREYVPETHRWIIELVVTPDPCAEEPLTPAETARHIAEVLSCTEELAGSLGFPADFAVVPSGTRFLPVVALLVDTVTGRGEPDHADDLAAQKAAVARFIAELATAGAIFRLYAFAPAGEGEEVVRPLHPFTTDPAVAREALDALELEPAGERRLLEAARAIAHDLAEAPRPSCVRTEAFLGMVLLGLDTVNPPLGGKGIVPTLDELHGEARPFVFGIGRQGPLSERRLADADVRACVYGGYRTDPNDPQPRALHGLFTSAEDLGTALSSLWAQAFARHAGALVLTGCPSYGPEVGEISIECGFALVRENVREMITLPFVPEGTVDQCLDPDPCSSAAAGASACQADLFYCCQEGVHPTEDHLCPEPPVRPGSPCKAPNATRCDGAVLLRCGHSGTWLPVMDCQDVPESGCVEHGPDSAACGEEVAPVFPLFPEDDPPADVPSPPDPVCEVGTVACGVEELEGHLVECRGGDWASAWDCAAYGLRCEDAEAFPTCVPEA